MNNKIVVGALELCSLPDLEITNLHMRVDTGAKTSSLHVDNIQKFSKNKEKWVSFDIHPDFHHVEEVVRREAKIKSVRKIKMSNEANEKRVIIDTTFKIADRVWTIELNLTDRSNMTYLMLLGREAMAGRLMVDPEKEYILEPSE
jgi:hypothetical protein